MKALWIRVEAHELHSKRVAELADKLGIERAHALGLYVALGGAVAEHTEDGRIDDVLDTTLEGWADWRGKKRDFARAVREVLQDGDGRLVDWLDSMGKLVERRAKDRERKGRGTSPEIPRKGVSAPSARPQAPQDSMEFPRNGRGVSSATVRDGTGRKATATTRRPDFPQDRESSARAARAGFAEVDTFDGCLALVQERLYIPDGKPPDDWDLARDGSILKALRAKNIEYRDIAVAIAGLALLRDKPGVYADRVDWLKRGEKVTLRALYNSESGVLSVFTLASMAFHKHQNLTLGAAAE